MNNTKQHKRTLVLTQMAVLIAIMLVLELTGIGMLKIGPLEMTILQFPVIVGAILMGPGAGAGLGFVFGMISFWECFGKSPFGVTLLGINPILTFLVCVPTRTLMGLLCGLIYTGLEKILVLRKENPSQGRILVPYVAASLGGALLNTLFFTTTLLICFGHTEFIQSLMQTMGAANLVTFAFLFVGIQGLVEAVICAFLGSVVSRGVRAVMKK